jgi:2-polyprenyl-6-hydroxyphenyl methylase/3-demethylubiquinone-9 3-methyltransferase
MPDDNLSSPSTVPGELAHYTALAEQWWDKSGPFWPLHQLNALRTQWIIRQLSNNGVAAAPPNPPLTGLRVLDIGCGGGILSEALAAQGAQVDGIDVVHKSIAIAQSHSALSNLKVNYTLASAESFAQREQRYDIVFNMEVVEHVAAFDTFMDTCCHLVRPGGLIFVATINRTLPALLFAIFGAEYLLRWLPRGTHHYAMLRKPREITAALQRNGFEVDARTGIGVNPLSRTLYLRRSESINYMLLARRADEDS